MKRTVLAMILALSCGHAGATTYNEAISAYREGEYALAVQGLFELAVNNDPDAQYVLGTLFEKGEKIEQNMPQALHWYEQAAAGANPFAQAALAAHLAKGELLGQDYARALELFLSAAQQGHPQSQYNAAVMFEQGLVGEPNLQAARHWYQEAAINGYVKAQYNLGVLLGSQVHESADLEQAYKWLSLASGDAHVSNELAQAAIDARNGLLEHMSATMLIKAMEQTTLAQQNSFMVVAAPEVKARGAATATLPSGEPDAVSDAKTSPLPLEPEPQTPAEPEFIAVDVLED